MNAWTLVGLGAAGALVAVYAYAVAALLVHHRLSRLAPPTTLGRALLVGALVPACGCTALPYARRAPPRLRAPFLLAAYAASPLLMAAAWLLAGAWAALTVVALALALAALARLLPEGERPRARLDDFLLRRDARPLRDAAPYLLPFGAPALAVGALVGGASLAHPALAGLAFAALAALLAAPDADVAQDHGRGFARRLRALHLAFALLGGLAVGLLAEVAA